SPRFSGTAGLGAAARRSGGWGRRTDPTPGCMSLVSQHTIAAWNASFARSLPKNKSDRIWMPTVFGAGPGVISTVAGSNGTAWLLEPRVAMAAHPGRTDAPVART